MRDTSPNGRPMLRELAARAARLASGGRTILGITGCPGAGKSAFAERLVEALDPTQAWVARVPMDGFHISDSALGRLGRRDRKGAIDTFDAYGYLAMLRRLRAELDRDVFAPDFNRDVAQPIAGSIAVGSAVRLVITEGNYLLAEAEPWQLIRAELAEVWYIDTDDEVRRKQLVARHVQFGKSPEEARRWVESVDEVNANLIRLTRSQATLRVDMGMLPSL